ncbi:amidohydrolase family protein [Kitasatospora sp. NPDC004669]|uniref:amidohydrolase family protein n=1 Tax=Kitasatospora sp. NPDC004669 TaxID=3154555 RepID=UPI0033A55D9B
MTTQRILVRGGWIVTMDARNREFPTGDVLIEDGRIAAVAADLSPAADASVIDASGTFVLPGLVDAHRHTWQTGLRQSDSEAAITEYVGRTLIGLGDEVRPEDVYAGTFLGALTALNAGITTVLDWAHAMNSPEHADAAVRALRDAGVRAVFGHAWPIGSTLDFAATHPVDIRRVREQLLPSDDGLVTLAMAAKGPDSSGIDNAVKDFGLARELGIPITTHLSTGRPGPDHQGIQQLHQAGLLGPDLNLVHVNGAEADALKLLADSGTTVSICPQIELTMPGLGGNVAVRRLRTAGVNPGLGVDTELASSGDLFTQMRFALAADRAETPDGEPALPAQAVLRMATVEGARAVHLGDRTGSIEPGKAADLVLVRTDDIDLVPVTTPAESLVLAAHTGNVDTVLVAGRVVKRGGRLVADTARARELALASVAHLRGVGR